MLHFLIVAVGRLFGLALLVGMVYYFFLMLAMLYWTITGKGDHDSSDWITWWSARHHHE